MSAHTLYTAFARTAGANDTQRTSRNMRPATTATTATSRTAVDIARNAIGARPSSRSATTQGEGKGALPLTATITTSSSGNSAGAHTERLGKEAIQAPNPNTNKPSRQKRTENGPAASWFVHVPKEPALVAIKRFLRENRTPSLGDERKKNDTVSVIDDKLVEMLRSASYSVSSDDAAKVEERDDRESQVLRNAWESRLDNFKMREFLYFRSSQLPSPARGLFFSHGSNGKADISLRGYDKFFEVGETKYGDWSALKEITRGPYYVTEKVNGFIMLVSQDPHNEERLLIASKTTLSDLYSTRSIAFALNETLLDVQDQKKELDNEYVACQTLKRAEHLHARIARDAVISHLESHGIEERQLAKSLKGITAVFEVVDDNLDEHVIKSEVGDQGIFLHGVNPNTVKFQSWSMEKVTDFANEFKLRLVQYRKCDSIDDVIDISRTTEMEGFNSTGKYIEGFVVRCTRMKQRYVAGVLKKDESTKAKSKNKANKDKLTEEKIEMEKPKSKPLIVDDMFDTDAPFFFKIKLKNNYGVFRDIRNMAHKIVGSTLGIIRSRGLRLTELDNYPEINEDSIVDLIKGTDERSINFQNDIKEIFNQTKFTLTALFVEWCFKDSKTLPWIIQVLKSKNDVNGSQIENDKEESTETAEDGTNEPIHLLETIRNKFLSDIGLLEASKDPKTFHPYVCTFSKPNGSPDINSINNSISAINDIKSFRDSYTLVMPFGPPGMGKSTLGGLLKECSERMITPISSDDNRKKFLDTFLDKFSPLQRVVYLDSLNHVSKTRITMMKQFFQRYPNGKVVLIQLGFFNTKDKVPYETTEECAMVLERIRMRSTNHRTLTYQEPTEADIKKFVNSTGKDKSKVAPRNSELLKVLSRIKHQADTRTFGVEEASTAKEEAIHELTSSSPGFVKMLTKSSPVNCTHIKLNSMEVEHYVKSKKGADAGKDTQEMEYLMDRITDEVIIHDNQSDLDLIESTKLNSPSTLINESIRRIKLKELADMFNINNERNKDAINELLAKAKNLTHE